MEATELNISVHNLSFSSALLCCKGFFEIKHQDVVGIQRTSSGWDIRKSLLTKERVFLAKEEASWDKSTLQVVRACGHLWPPVPVVLSEPRFLSRAVNSFKIKISVIPWAQATPLPEAPVSVLTQQR